jgi:hypothetical protein
MSNKKTTKKSQWGGRREGSGRRGRKLIGGTEKISVSVTKEVLRHALNKWHDTRSQLVDHLLRKFVRRKAAV